MMPVDFFKYITAFYINRKKRGVQQVQLIGGFKGSKRVQHKIMMEEYGKK